MMICFFLEAVVSVSLMVMGVVVHADAGRRQLVEDLYM